MLRNDHQHKQELLSSRRNLASSPRSLKSGGEEHAGAVMASVLLYWDHGDTAPSTIPVRTMLVGWVGDCRVVLSEHAGQARLLTLDHNPKDPREKERVEKAGAFLQRDRVNGILAVTRSFGDLPFKNLREDMFELPLPSSSPMVSLTEECSQCDIWESHQPIIAKPDIGQYPLYKSCILSFQSFHLTFFLFPSFSSHSDITYRTIP